MNLRTTAFAALQRLLAPLIGIACLDVQNAATAGAATLKAATAASLSAVTLTAADLISGGKLALAACPRQLRFTVAGSTPSDAPATAVIVGRTLEGPATETVTIPQTATTVDTSRFWIEIISIAYPVGQGTDCTVAIGFTTALGLPYKLKGRGASSAVVPILREYVDGVSTQPLTQHGTDTLASGTKSVSAALTAASTIQVTMRDPGAGALTDFGGFDTPVASRNTGASTFVVNAIQGADKATLTTAACTFDWEVQTNANTQGTLTAAGTHLPYGSYTPAASVVPNATRDYVVMYELDA